MDPASTTESQNVPVNPPMYPSATYRPLTMETAVAGRHSEALLNLARSRAAAENAGKQQPTFLHQPWIAGDI